MSTFWTNRDFLDTNRAQVGAPGEIRTPDPLVRRLSLSRAQVRDASRESQHYDVQNFKALRARKPLIYERCVDRFWTSSVGRSGEKRDIALRLIRGDYSGPRLPRPSVGLRNAQRHGRSAAQPGARFLQVAGLLASVGVTAAFADVPPSALQTLMVQAQSSLVAAIRCHDAHYAYMMRLSPMYVLCLRTNVAAPQAIDVAKFLKLPPEPKPEAAR